MQVFEYVLLDRAFFVIIGAIFGLLAKEGLGMLSGKSKSLGIGLALMLLAGIFLIGLPYFERLFNFDMLASLIFISSLLFMAFIFFTKINFKEPEVTEIIENE